MELSLHPRHKEKESGGAQSLASVQSKSAFVVVGRSRSSLRIASGYRKAQRRHHVPSSRVLLPPRDLRGDLGMAPNRSRAPLLLRWQGHVSAVLANARRLLAHTVVKNYAQPSKAAAAAACPSI